MRNKTFFYTYHLVDPRDNLPFYVGKGIGDRMYEHEKDVKKELIPNRGTNPYLFRKIKKILKEERDIIYKKILENVSAEEALEKEICEIKKYGIINDGGILCNLTHGGEGVVGYTWNTKQKNKFKKIINSNKWRIAYELGRKKVDWKSVRLKQSITLKKKFQEDPTFLMDHKRRMLQIHSSKEAREKNSKNLIRYYKNHPEQREKLSKIQRKLWASGKYDNSKKWIFISPYGKVVTFKNLSNHCRKNNLTQSNMIAVSKGLRTHHKGWKYYKNTIKN